MVSSLNGTGAKLGFMGLGIACPTQAGSEKGFSQYLSANRRGWLNTHSQIWGAMDGRVWLARNEVTGITSDG